MVWLQSERAIKLQTYLFFVAAYESGTIKGLISLFGGRFAKHDLSLSFHFRLNNLVLLSFQTNADLFSSLILFFSSVGAMETGWCDGWFRCRSGKGYPAKVCRLQPLRQVNTAPEWRIVAIRTRLQGNHGSRNGSIASALRLSLELGTLKHSGTSESCEAAILTTAPSR